MSVYRLWSAIPGRCHEQTGCTVESEWYKEARDAMPKSLQPISDLLKITENHFLSARDSSVDTFLCMETFSGIIADFFFNSNTWQHKILGDKMTPMTSLKQ